MNGREWRRLLIDAAIFGALMALLILTAMLATDRTDCTEYGDETWCVVGGELQEVRQ